MPCISLHPDAKDICNLTAGISVNLMKSQSLFANFKVGKSKVLVHKNLMAIACHNAKPKEGDAVSIFEADYGELEKKQIALFIPQNFEETDDLIIHFAGEIASNYKVSIVNSDYAVLTGGINKSLNNNSSTFEALVMLKPGQAFYFSIRNLKNDKTKRCKAVWKNNHFSVCLILNGKEQPNILNKNIYVFNDIAKNKQLTNDINVNCA